MNNEIVPQHQLIMQYYGLIMAFPHQIQNAKHLKNMDDINKLNYLTVMILFPLGMGGMTNILYRY